MSENHVVVFLDIPERRTAVIVFAVSFCTADFWDVQSMMVGIRDQFEKRVILIAGGPHPTGDVEGTLKLGFDYVVQGEGESAFIDNCKSIMHDSADLSSLSKGSYCKANQTPCSVFALDDYPSFAFKSKRFNSIEITRGCPFACKFCQTSRLQGRKMRHYGVCKCSCWPDKQDKQRNNQ